MQRIRNRKVLMRRWSRPQRFLGVGLAIWLVGSGCQPGTTEDDTSLSAAATLRIGVLFDTSGPLADFGRTGEDGVRLAAEHIASAGGIFGQPLDLRFGDGNTDVDVAVEEARRLVEIEDSHALIGPLGSGAALSIVTAISRPARIPTLSPTATAPALSTLADDGFFFRGTASDAAQAPVLAGVAESLGAQHAVVFFEDDAYGHGLSDAFGQHFSGTITSVPVGPTENTADYHAILGDAVAQGADLLVAMSYVPSAVDYLHIAIDQSLFDNILLVDATASLDLVDELGAEALEGIGGTAPAGSVPGLESGRGSEAFNIAFESRFGQAPSSGLEAVAYDLVVSLALAAERAGTSDGESIRDALPQVTGKGGQAFGPGASSIAEALERVRANQDVDYQGASSSLEWDDKGDLATGSISLWAFRDGVIVETGQVPFDTRIQSP